MISIVGMAGRFPRCDDLDAFWQRIERGERCIDELPAGDADGLVPARAVLRDADSFDPEPFNLPEGEARRLDRQHRLFLEASWLALEDAALDPSRRPDLKVAVYGTCLPSEGVSAATESAAAAYGQMLATSPDFMATRVSYLLSLRGESMNVQTGCSSSLVAVHLAARSLLAGDCDVALAGGVAVEADQASGYLFEESMIMSPDGRCRPFDRGASGTVPGAGVAVVVLRRSADAEREGDPVRAQLVGSALNNDGRQKLGFTAPSVRGQEEAIVAALAAADLEPEDIGFVEAHGTGTQLGDPLEFDALSRAFRRGTDRRGFCAIGALKGGFGHMDRAAGIAGLVKTVLCLERQTIPPLVEFEEPNPELDAESSPFYFPTGPEPWDGPVPRRAGVSSFGIGGTNAHAILQEAA